MIKIIKTYTCDSYFRSDIYYDRAKIEVLKVYFLGVKVFEKQSNFVAESIEEFNKKLGFNK